MNLMPNPFNVQHNPIKDMYKAVTQSNNPMQMFMNIAGNNPKMQPIIRALRQGTNPKQIFDEMCQQRGINPQEFLNNITK